MKSFIIGLLMWCPITSLLLNLAGSLLIAFSVFPSGERGTSPGFQLLRNKKILFGMISITMFRWGCILLLTFSYPKME